MFEKPKDLYMSMDPKECFGPKSRNKQIPKSQTQMGPTGTDRFNDSVSQVSQPPSSLNQQSKSMQSLVNPEQAAELSVVTKPPLLPLGMTSKTRNDHGPFTKQEESKPSLKKRVEAQYRKGKIRKNSNIN